MPLLLLLVCLTVFKPTALADPVSKVIETEVKKRQIPGLAYAVVGKDGVLKSGAFGYADLQTGTRATVDSVFEIASLTKQFTATRQAQV